MIYVAFGGGIEELREALHNAIQDCCFKDGTINSWLQAPKDVEQHVYDKLAALSTPPSGEVAQEPRLTLKEILEVLYHGRTMVNFSHVPEVTRAIDWLSLDFRAALERMGKTT